MPRRSAEVLDNWDEATKVNFDHQVWDELCSLRFIDAGHNVMIMGPVGVGKTYSVSRPGRRLAQAPPRQPARQLCVGWTSQAPKCGIVLS